MKAILIVLALAYSALARPDGTTEGGQGGAVVAALRDSCAGNCILKPEYKEWFQQALPKARDFGKQLAEGGDTQAFIPEIPTDRLGPNGKYCQAVNNISTCVTACPDDEKKTKALTISEKIKTLACDAEIDAKFTCLRDLSKTASPACNTQCESFKAPILDAYNSYKTTGQRDWEKAKTAGKAVCQLVNCRLKCRKADIEAKCGADGYAAAKKLTQSLADVAKTTHAQFRPTQNFPEECNPEKVVEGA